MSMNNCALRIITLTISRLVRSAVIAGVVCLGLSCQDSKIDFSKWKMPSKPLVEPAPDKATLKAQAERQAAMKKTGPLPETVGAVCYLEGMRPMVVQGYGLVVGLPGTGSSGCPEALRKELTETIVRYQKMYGEKEGTRATATALLSSKHAAVVRVTGTIPAGASKGSRFNLAVQALPNTGTLSIEGGRLYTCDLRIYTGPVGPGTGSKVYAQGEGPVFINPFEKKPTQGKTLLTRRRPVLSGIILNGGTNLEDRRISLILHQPSYGTARAIEQKINSLFGPPPDNPLWQTAKAVGSNKIELSVPRQWRTQFRHFIGLVMNAPIRSDPSYLETRATEMARQVGDPGANAVAISYAWETMGRHILPLIQPLYTSTNRQAAFYAAKTGARLGDSVAMEQLGVFAADSKNIYRKRAVRTLGFCPEPASRRALRKLLDDPDMDIRILAYRGLARLNDGCIERRIINSDNTILDVVASKAWPMVYVTRSGQSRIVLFGKIKLEPPVFYCHPDDSITVSANANDKQVSLIRKTPSGKSSGVIKKDLDLPALIDLMANEAIADPKDGTVYGLGLSYSHVVAFLNEMCKDGAIPAKFKMQDLSASATDPADDMIGRPEKD